MGKQTIAQRRGRGTTVYRANSHRALAKVRYSADIKNSSKAKIIDMLNDPLKTTPVVKIKLDNMAETLTLASEGTRTGDTIEIGSKAKIKPGNILPLRNIPEGTPVFNIEARPNDGGKFVRSSGVYAIVASHDVGKTVIKMPSKQFKSLNPDCRATIGVAAGGDMKSKPFVKAGNKWVAMHKKGRLYPRTSARAMNAVDHKFGGSNLGVAKTVGRNASPGRKVGTIASKRTGKKR